MFGTSDVHQNVDLVGWVSVWARCSIHRGDYDNTRDGVNKNSTKVPNGVQTLYVNATSNEPLSRLWAKRWRECSPHRQLKQNRKTGVLRLLIHWFFCFIEGLDLSMDQRSAVVDGCMLHSIPHNRILISDFLRTRWTHPIICRTVIIVTRKICFRIL